jgi:hypothetical protein
MLAVFDSTGLLLGLHGPTSISALFSNNFSEIFPGREPDLYQVTVFTRLLLSHFGF